MPGLDHAVSPMTRRTDDDPYGCHGLPRMYGSTLVQDGWLSDGRRWMVSIPEVMSKDCRYDHSMSDKRCAGCAWAGSGEAYSEMIRRDGK